jgi:hypothetical protein
MKLPLHQLNTHGISHIIVPLVVIVSMGVIGTFYLVLTNAATPSGSVQLSDGVNGACLDNYHSNATDYNKVDIWSCNKTKAQSWTLDSTTSSKTGGPITNVNGLCLDVYHSKTASGTTVDLFKCNKTAAQNWYVNGTAIINPHSNLCLTDTASSTVNGTQATIATCASSKAQAWTVSALGTSPTPPPSGGGGSGGGSGGGGTTSGTYTVVGNTIKDANGQAVLIHGVNRPSMEWSCNGASVTNGPGPIPASDFTTMRKAWNANAVRIPLDQDFWLSTAARHCSSYQSNVAAVVQNARAAGLIVILDLHWSDKGNLANTSPGQQCMADQNSVAFWQQVANTYKSNPNVWFELYNEPHDISWNAWLNGGSVCGFQAVGMQALYNAVRGTGAKNIVIAGGNAWASSLNGQPAITGTNVAYAIHLYRQNAGWSTTGFDSQFGNSTTKEPVISTEFGDQVCDGQGFDQSLLNYFRAHKVGYTGWAWFVQGCTWPSLITNVAGTCNNAAAACVIQKDMQSYQ